MSSPAGTLRRGARPKVAAFVAVGLVLALIGGTLASLSAGTVPAERDREATSEDGAPVPGAEGANFEVLRGVTGSAVLDSAIDRLVDSERFRFDLVMSGGGESKGGWKVTGEADLSSSSSDAPRLHAQVAIGAARSYTVISDQVRIGSQLFVLDPESGRYIPQAEKPGARMIDTDPVSSMLESVFGLNERAFSYRSRGGVDIVLARTADSKSTLRVSIDSASGTLKRIDLSTGKIDSSLRLSDVGDPTIAIANPTI